MSHKTDNVLSTKHMISPPYLTNDVYANEV